MAWRIKLCSPRGGSVNDFSGRSETGRLLRGDTRSVGVAEQTRRVRRERRKEVGQSEFEFRGIGAGRRSLDKVTQVGGR